jgi:hypothetical protein
LDGAPSPEISAVALFDGSNRELLLTSVIGGGDVLTGGGHWCDFAEHTRAPTLRMFAMALCTGCYSNDAAFQASGGCMCAPGSIKLVPHR